MSEEYDNYNNDLDSNQWSDEDNQEREEKQAKKMKKANSFSLASLADFLTGYSNNFRRRKVRHPLVGLDIFLHCANISAVKYKKITCPKSKTPI